MSTRPKTLRYREALDAAEQRSKNITILSAEQRHFTLNHCTPRCLGNGVPRSFQTHC